MDVPGRPTTAFSILSSDHDPWSKWPVCVESPDPAIIKGVHKSLDNAYHAASRWPHAVFVSAIELWWCTMNRFTPGVEERYMEIVEVMGKDFVNALVPGFGLLLKHFFHEGCFADVLGAVYMEIRSNWGKSYLGQYFTPWPVCMTMAQMTMGSLKDLLASGDDITVNDPACGSGTTLLAARAVVARDYGRKVSQRIKLSGQDIDQTCVRMAQIQIAMSDEKFMRSFMIASQDP